MTESNPHALAFVQANTELNGRDDLIIQKLDWQRPGLMGSFDVIIGSEVMYKERDFGTLDRLFRTLLAPGGEILLAAEMRPTTMAFFRQMQAGWSIEARRMVMRAGGDETRIVLAKMSHGKQP